MTATFGARAAGSGSADLSLGKRLRCRKARTISQVTTASQIDDTKRSKVPPDKAAIEFRCLNPRRFLRVPRGLFPTLPHTGTWRLLARFQLCRARVPPAVMLLAIVTVLFVFGGFAVIFAGPIAVIIFVAVNKLYVRGSLGERTMLPGEDAK